MNQVSRPTVFVMEAQGKAALPVIESLARGGLRVAAGSEKRVNSGFYSRGCRERHVYPSPRHARAEFQSWLLRFLSERNIATLFPVGHYGALAVCEIQDEIRKYSRVIIPELQTFMAGYAKIPTMKAAISAGVPIPQSWFPCDISAGIDEVIGQIKDWPVLVKPSIGVGARGIVWCHGESELRQQYEVISKQCGEAYVQDFVPPGGMQYKVDMLVDQNQRLLAGIVYGKTRMYPPDGGSSVLNYSADRPDILDDAYKMLKELKWVGICDFDFVEDPRDGVTKLMEINPRFPESFHMGTSVGIDFPMMIHKLAHDEPVDPVLDYPTNRFLRFLPGDLLWYLRSSKAQRRATWPSWFQFLDSRTSFQLIRASDPGPIIGYLLENMMAFFDPALRRERLRMKSGNSAQRK